MTSYDGKVFYGLDADRDALPDLDVLAACIRESLDELVDASSSSRGRAPRGKVTKQTATPTSTTRKPVAKRAVTKKTAATKADSKQSGTRRKDG